MKFNLVILNGLARSGYQNISLLGWDGFQTGSVVNLDCGDAEATEIVALDVVDYLPATQVNSTLEEWIRKLRYGGTLCVGGVDLREVSRAFLGQEVSLSQANMLLHGSQRFPADYKKANLTIQVVLEMFRDAGMKVLTKQLSDYRYVVTARRPTPNEQ